ncbi:ferredoxin [Sinorhizobium sp. BG8]|uniref:ferredoxin n=1 Tax=Sinorhizobium sp. BG8 TaxID=2613773 RepID=UPI001AF831A1|nr:ferredoxin [Sinorhizobium sp. BG8]QRM56955.1 4Fe-4S dicluster domain-containing protein [Sinorhizobium sp. BG8]
MAQVRDDPPPIEEIRAALRPHGLFLRGSFDFTDGETVPALADGRPAAGVVLVGNIGGSMWAAFSAWREGQRDRGGSDPLDTWSKAVIGPVAHRFGGTAWFPSDQPWQPFQQWAMRSEAMRPSPLGILIHPVYGLWHGYRGALGFASASESPAPRARTHPCDACAFKPCISHCPASALTIGGFDVGRCRSHLATSEGRTGCLDGGCLARSACPVGSGYRYGAEQIRFHMAALDV